MTVRHSKKTKLSHFSGVGAFTLVEVLVALSIIVISLVPLLHLLVVSILMADSAERLSQATLIGNAKLAEAVGEGYPEIGIDSDSIEIEKSDTVFDCQVSVTDAHIRELEDMGLTGLRRVNVAVIWNEGRRQRQISLSKYFSMDQTTARMASEGKSIWQQ